MKRATRMLVVLLPLVAIVVIASAVQFDGALHAESPRLAALIAGSAGWYSQPQLVSNGSEPEAIYVVAPALPHGDQFDAVRIDTQGGGQRAASVTLGPDSPYKPFLPGHVRADVHGLRFRRPAPHLMTLPDGRGPGVHAVDSATGRIVIVFDDGGTPRRLLTRNAFNSSNAAEMLSLVSADPGGRWIAALSRGSGGWMLFLFPRRAASRRAETHSEEL